MAIDYLNKNGLSYFWSKLKAYFAPKAHTHNAFETKHSYTTAANAAKNWYRIANANTSQTDTTKPIHAQFILRSYNTSYDAGYRECWLINAVVYGRLAHITVFGNQSAPFSQARLLYESTVADLDTNDRPAIDIYLNYQLANGTTKIEIEEIYNGGGWTFVPDGQIAASTIPSGFENVATAPRSNGVNNSTYCDWASYTSLQRSNFTANFTLADNNTYRARVLNCTGTITVTVPSINSVNSWFIIKNFNTTSGVITIHPSTTSVLIDGSNADITLQPGEYVMIHSKAANAYTMIMDGRWKSQKMTRGSYERIQGTSTAHNNLNNYIDAGFYNVKTQYVDNCPTGIGVDAVLLVYPWNQGSYCTQEITESAASGDTRRWIRKLNSSTWSAWKQVAFASTTLAGYGITDAKIANGTITLGSNSITPITSHQTLPTLSRTISGSGNAITDITVSNHAITATKGSTFALDSNVIHKNDNEVIEGTKTFQNSYHESTREGEEDYTSSSLLIRIPDYDKGTDAETNHHGNIVILDRDGTNQNWNGRLGVFEHVVYEGATRANQTRITAYRNIVSGGEDFQEYVALGVGYDEDGNKYSVAPSTSSSRNSGNDILTRDWIPQDTRIVHTTGGETISGNKTFNNALYFNDTGISTFRLKYGNDVNLPSTLPTSNKYAGLGVYNSSGDVLLYDYHRVDSSNGNVAKVWQLHSSRNLSDSEHFEFIYVKDSDSFYLTGPAEFAANDSSAKIPNTSWIRSATGNFACNAATATTLSSTLAVSKGGTGLTSLDTFVRTTGDQSVGGVKTFTSSPAIERINPYLNFNETDANRAANVDGYQGIWFNDKNNKAFGAVLAVEETVSGQSKPNIMTELKTYGYGSTDVQRIIVFEQENGSSTIWSFQPRGGNNDIRLGNAGNRWKQLYATTSSIDTSDERMKSDINAIPDEVLDAWDSIEWYTFKMNDAIEEKGIANARIHSGLIAQRIISVFEQHLLDPFKYSFICYDSWEGKPASYDKEGNLLTPEEKSGDEYSLRYVEALCIEAAYQRRENARLKKRVADLEERLAALELRLGSE